MALTQKYGIKYPFLSDNTENVFLDTNKTIDDSVKSQVMHVIFTQRGQKIRDPEFGTNLITYLFGAFDDINMSAIKQEIASQVTKYVPNVIFDDINIYHDENDNNNMIVSIVYSVKTENGLKKTTVALKI